MIGKLFKRMFLEVISPIGWCILSSWILIFLPFIMGGFFRDSQVAGVVTVLALLGLFAVHIAIFFNTIGGDYHNMEGKRAYFYRSLPVTGFAFTTARALYYLAYALITMLSLILQAVVILSLLFRMKLAESGFSLFFSRIRAVLSTIFIPRNTGLFLLNILLGLLVMHALIAMSISVGSMGCFKKLKQGGPFLVFFISQLAVDQIGKWIMRSLNFSSLYDKDFSLAWGDFAQGQIQSGNLSEGIYMVLIDALPMTLFWAFITVIAWAITIYITDRKISLA